jgi:methionyl-tRNA formyltransferase
MRIVLWVGNKANQKALANKIHAQFPVVGIITESRLYKQKITLNYLMQKSIEKVFLNKINAAWNHLKNYYDKNYPNFPAVETLNVENINSSEAFEFTEKLQADLIIVSGTRLVKDKMLSLKPKIGILNLHTGLSPYIKGGPNCTNWCIATEQYHLVGNTIMWIDAGIDTGNILTTEFTPFDGKEDLNAIHLKVMEHAHDLYLKAIGSVVQNKQQSIPQSNISKGKTYYTKDWTLKQKIKLMLHVKKFNQYWCSNRALQDQAQIQTISLKS